MISTLKPVGNGGRARTITAAFLRCDAFTLGFTTSRHLPIFQTQLCEPAVLLGGL